MGLNLAPCPLRKGEIAAMCPVGRCRKSETTFMKHNRKLADKYGLRFSGRVSEQAKHFAQIRELEVLGP